MLIWFWTKFLQISKVFLCTYISYTKFSKVFLHMYISLTKSYVYLLYNVLGTEGNVYKSFVRIFVQKLVMDCLDVNRLVTDSPYISNTPSHE